MAYVTLLDLPEIQSTDINGNEYIMVTDEIAGVSSKFTVDSMVIYVGEHFDNTVDSKLAFKVDKILGKGLSTEDFSTLEKQKLESLDNYIHPESGVLAGSYTKVTVDSLGHITTGSNPTTLQELGITDAINISELGVPNGVATLNELGFIESTQLPDTVLRFNSILNFPVTGEQNKIYITTDNNKIYRWDNSYVRIGSIVDSVAGRTGNIILSKVDVGLNNVNNTSDINKNVFSATKLTTPRSINGVNFDGTSNIIIEANDPNKVTANEPIIGGTFTKITYDNKGLVLSGENLSAIDIPGVDANKITSGIISSDRLPSYVDDVLEFTDLLNFPITGETGKIYVALDTNKAYRWSGSTYIYITSGAVDSVAGKTGVVTLTKDDVGLNNVDNTTDLNKPISTATQTELNNRYTKTEVQTILPKVGFDTTNIIPPLAGQISWNIDENTLDLGLNGATLQLGQEQLIRVRNNTVSTITNGSAVMATGTIGNSGRITIGNANLTQANAKYILGIVTENIISGADGFVTAFGKVRGIQTNGGQYGETWVDGDVIYVKDSGNGALTKVVPLDTQVKLPIAIVVNAHATNGTLFIRVNSIDENHAKAELALKANALDAVLTGSPTATTASVGNSTTRIATTAFVVNEINKIEEW